MFYAKFGHRNNSFYSRFAKKVQICPTLLKWHPKLATYRSILTPLTGIFLVSDFIPLTVKTVLFFQLFHTHITRITFSYPNMECRKQSETRLKFDRKRSCCVTKCRPKGCFLLSYRTNIYDLPTLSAYSACQNCYPFFPDFSCFWYLNAKRALVSCLEPWPFHLFLRSCMVYKSLWKWPPGFLSVLFLSLKKNIWIQAWTKT